MSPSPLVARCCPRFSRRIVLSLLLALLSSQAFGHFLLNLNVRIFHVDHRADGLAVFVRMPMPYLVADKVGSPQADGLPEPAPYTTNGMEGERIVHFVDFNGFRNDPDGLGRILADGIRMIGPDGPLAYRLQDTRVYRLGAEPPFATLEEAMAAFSVPLDLPEDDAAVYVGDALVDAALFFPLGEPIGEYRISVALDPGLPDQDKTANLILDYGPGGTKVHRARGLLTEPITVSRSALAAFGTFVREGVRHILEGLDHVLFVLCLVAGSTVLSSLLWRVTGFTLGHSITLSLGFFGFVPSASWFVPAIETAIAASIVYAAAVALIPRLRSLGNERTIFFVTAFIGLIHGLGFSFVLQNILKVTAPNIWQSLLAFNLGIELGQLVIVCATGASLWLASKVHERLAAICRTSLCVLAGAVALFWVVERGLLLGAQI